MTNLETADPPIVWDAFKAVIRVECISAIKKERVEQNPEVQLLKNGERECAENNANSPSGSSYVELLEARRLLTQ